MKTFADFEIDLHGRSGVEVPTICPQCSPHRKKPKAKCLSVNTEKGVWCCHHCAWTGSLKTGTDQASQRPRVIIRPAYKPLPPEGALLDWFLQRGVPPDLVEREGISLVRVYMPQVEDEVACIAFPYYRSGEVVNVKYRVLDGKAFRQETAAEKVLYRLDSVTTDQVIITEGEVDALSCVVASFASVVSVPDGAPPADAKNLETKFAFLNGDPLGHVEKIILATDNDGPGRKLTEELARRLGRDRCYSVQWPSDCKDANDVLRVYGKDALCDCLKQAQPWPVEDVVFVGDLAGEVADVYAHGLPPGLSTGWTSVNEHYTIGTGQLTIITGIPSHGKSEFLDALMNNLATLHNWLFAVCSPENWPPSLHVIKLLQKHTGKPFREGPSLRMSSEELAQGLQWLHDRFFLILPGRKMSVSDVLSRATSLVRRYGIHGLVLDPFNEFDHTRPHGMTETEYICNTLGELKRWARQWSVHVWIVAHPQKLYRRDDGTYPVPTPYDISGSAHWRNRADNCLTVWRDLEDESGQTFLYVQKVRHRHMGKVGKVILYWNPITGQYYEDEGYRVTPAATYVDKASTGD